MRIVFLSYHYSPDISSPEEWMERIKFYIGWNECLAKKHIVIRVDQINYKGNFKHNGIQFFCVEDGKKKNYFPGKLNRFVNNLNPDIILVSSFQYPLQVIQLRYCVGKKVKIILQHHAEKQFKGLKKYIQYFASRKVNAFLFTSFKSGIEWVRNKNLDSEKKIYELLEVSSTFHPVNRIKAIEKTNISGGPVFLWVGRLNLNKDPLTVVRAFLKFSLLQSNATLYMIFQTEELIKEIIDILPSKYGTCSVKLVGRIPHDELLYWFNSADFYVSASHYEGSGTALCEAMSCGCIPVVSDIPSFRTIGGNCGIFFEPGNEISLLSALRESVNLHIDEMRIKTLDRFKADLSFEAISSKFQEILGSL
jgi:glycosyltransferase involved in cell wall biosynthesis